MATILTQAQLLAALETAEDAGASRQVTWLEDASVTVARLYAVAEVAQELAVFAELLSGLLKDEYPLQAGAVGQIVSRLQNMTSDLLGDGDEIESGLWKNHGHRQIHRRVGNRAETADGGVVR